jgi:hypothetical protein
VKPVDHVLKRLEGIRQCNGAWKALCPAHADREPSLSVTEGNDGRALIKCFAGCRTEDVLASLGLEMSDLFEQRNGHDDKGFRSIPPKMTATVQPCSLKNYAEVKGLPVEFLQNHGLRDQKYQGQPAVRISYRGMDGSEEAVQYRIALKKSEKGYDRFRWRTGSKAMLYGLWRLEKIRKVGWIVLVEGESDTQTLWYHGIPALGIPGADTWKREWAGYLDGVERIYVVVEPDKGGETLREALAATASLRDRIYLVELGEHKDVSGLYLSDREGFRDNLKAVLRHATSLVEVLGAERKAEARRAWAECEDLVLVPNILHRFAQDLARAGVAGESRLAKLLYLAVTSRLLEKPVSITMKGPSSGGKSYLTEQVLGFFPDEAYYALTAMSEHAMAYSEEPLAHRFLVIYEAAGMNSDFQTYLIRSLLSEGCVRYETVEKTSEGMKPRLIEREGPTGLIVTTTAVKLHPENETRLISLTVTDTQQQTRDIMAALADEGAADGPDLDSWHALQQWLARAERRVTIPYAKELAAKIPPLAVRLRRDFGALLNLIRAHALLHQANRERDREGRIIATIADYAIVRGLVADLVSEGIEATVAPTVRETVATVGRLHDETEKAATLRDIAEELKLDKSTASRRVRTAIDKGFIKNLEDQRGKPGRYVPADPLPEDVEILPLPEVLQCCTVAGDSEGFKKNIFAEVPEEAGNGKFVSTPPKTDATAQHSEEEKEEEIDEHGWNCLCNECLPT